MMEYDVRKSSLSASRGKEPGVLLDFMDWLYDTVGVKKDTAYNYYMTARSLAKFLKKWRYNIPCAPDEVVMKRVDADELLSITQDEWEKYIRYYRYDVYEASGSLAVRISVIRKLYKWLGDTTKQEVPAFILRARRPISSTKEHTEVTPVMEEAIFKSLKGEMLMRNACIISMVLDCGLGLDEVAELQMEDLELDRIRVRGTNGRPNRYIPLQQRTKEAVDAYLPVRIPPIDGGNSLFVSNKKGKLGRGAIQKMLRKAVRISGYANKGVTFRDIQQTSLSRLAAEEGLKGLSDSARASSDWYIKQKYGLTTRKNVRRKKSVSDIRTQQAASVN